MSNELTALPKLPDGWDWVCIRGSSMVNAWCQESRTNVTVLDGEIFIADNRKRDMHSAPIPVILAVLAANNALPNSGSTPQ